MIRPTKTKGRYICLSPQASENAFTLLELLVVVAIIGILVALIGAATGRVRQMAKRIQCLNNIRQFAVADLAYFSDHGELPPMQGIVPSSISADRLSSVVCPK